MEEIDIGREKEEKPEWVETYPDGKTEVMTFVRFAKEKVDGIEIAGTVLRKINGHLIFIPHTGNESNLLCLGYPPRKGWAIYLQWCSDQPWTNLGEMKNVVSNAPLIMGLPIEKYGIEELKKVGGIYLAGLGWGRVGVNIIRIVELYQAALDRGDTEAKRTIDKLFTGLDSKDSVIGGDHLNLVGLLYQEGKEIKRNYKEARRWYQKAIERGNAVAYRNLGVHYECGYDIEKNYPTAAKYYQQALERGHTGARKDLEDVFNSTTISREDLNSIGNMYHDAFGVERDYKEAKRWYEKSALRGHSIAYRNLGVLCEFGDGIEKNNCTAVKYYQQALDKGYREAKKDMERLFNSSDISGADLNSMGMLYECGEEIKKDFNEARRWYEKAVKKSHLNAYHNLGLLYEWGSGVEKNYPAAAKYYQQALDIDKDYAEAKEDLKRIFFSSNISGADLNAIGMLYYQQGQGIKQDYKEAVRWCEKAAEKGLAVAHYHLGMFYEYGHGVTKNWETAKKYYSQALAGGYVQAEAAIKRLKEKSGSLKEEKRKDKEEQDTEIKRFSYYLQECKITTPLKYEEFKQTDLYKGFRIDQATKDMFFRTHAGQYPSMTPKTPSPEDSSKQRQNFKDLLAVFAIDDQAAYAEFKEDDSYKTCLLSEWEKDRLFKLHKQEIEKEDREFKLNIPLARSDDDARSDISSVYDSDMGARPDPLAQTRSNPSTNLQRLNDSFTFSQNSAGLFGKSSGLSASLVQPKTSDIDHTFG